MERQNSPCNAAFFLQNEIEPYNACDFFFNWAGEYFMFFTDFSWLLYLLCLSFFAEWSPTACQTFVSYFATGSTSIHSGAACPQAICRGLHSPVGLDSYRVWGQYRGCNGVTGLGTDSLQDDSQGNHERSSSYLPFCMLKTQTYSLSNFVFNTGDRLGPILMH